MKKLKDEEFLQISPADFFYRNRDLAGFNNPVRALYAAIRELVENSLDACELHSIVPKIYVRLISESDLTKSIVSVSSYKLKVIDNGSGVSPEYIPMAFAQVLYGSKYKLRQVRGTFGLGGKMAILYGQITTNSSVQITSSIGGENIYKFELRLDIQRNKPITLNKQIIKNIKKWHGTIVEFFLEGNYIKAMPKIIDYFRQTAIVNPYADITFIDPSGRLYRFESVTSTMPEPPKETLPHPYGCDVETLQRMISNSEYSNLLSFMMKNFHRVGKKTAEKFLKFAGLNYKKDPKKLDTSEIVQVAQAMKNFENFLPPDANCLSPLGEDLLEKGIRKELKPEFVAIEKRNPSAYSGYPFIIEVGIAYGGDIPLTPGISLYRFANRIPLLYDEASDVSRKVINEINWNYYKVSQNSPVALIVHICSTKIPYRTVGKEFIADRPEVEHEIKNAITSVSRRLSLFLSKKISYEHEKIRMGIFTKYLPKIAIFSTTLAEKTKVPNVDKLLRVVTHGREED